MRQSIHETRNYLTSGAEGAFIATNMFPSSPQCLRIQLGGGPEACLTEVMSASVLVWRIVPGTQHQFDVVDPSRHSSDEASQLALLGRQTGIAVSDGLNPSRSP